MIEQQTSKNSNKIMTKKQQSNYYYGPV